MSNMTMMNAGARQQKPMCKLLAMRASGDAVWMDPTILAFFTECLFSYLCRSRISTKFRTYERYFLRHSRSICTPFLSGQPIKMGSFLLTSYFRPKYRAGCWDSLFACPIYGTTKVILVCSYFWLLGTVIYNLMNLCHHPAHLCTSLHLLSSPTPPLLSSPLLSSPHLLSNTSSPTKQNKQTKPHLCPSKKNMA